MRRRDQRRLEEQLDRVEDKLRTIEIAFMVSGPNNPVVADAYNGLRQQVVMAASERRAHLTQLAAFASAVDDGATSTELASLVQEWMRQHALVRVGADTHPDAYDIKGSGSHLQVRKAAYLDANTGAIINLGHAVAGRPPVAAPATSADTDNSNHTPDAASDSAESFDFDQGAE